MDIPAHHVFAEAIDSIAYSQIPFLAQIVAGLVEQSVLFRRRKRLFHIGAIQKLVSSIVPFERSHHPVGAVGFAVHEVLQDGIMQWNQAVAHVNHSPFLLPLKNFAGLTAMQKMPATIMSAPIH